MPPKKKALWMIGKDAGQTKSPFSTIDDAISACDEIINIFISQLPPLTAKYWIDVKEELVKMK